MALRQALTFRILGSLDLDAGDSSGSLGGRKQRALLAVLLLHGGEAVSTDQLIDALWGAEAPASAANSIHIYVSQLRKAIGPERLVTRGRGYAIELDDDELDAKVFEALLEQGRARLRDGRAEEAADALSEGLALWHGPALEDFRYEDFAQAEIARLEELRELALEERIDAQLALGQGSELVPELEWLVREHPLRERLRAQLMLALYRSGRQADALEAYQGARRTLGEELGLEPGHPLRELEQAILTQDPTLEGPPRRGLLSAATRGPRRGLVLAGAALLLGATAVGTALSLSEGGSARLASVAAGSLASIDAKTSRVTAAARIADAPARLATDGRALWVTNDSAETVSKLDPRSYAVTEVVPVHAFPSDMAVGEGAVWIVDTRTGRLEKVDPVYGTVVRGRAVVSATALYDRDREGLDPDAVAAGAGSVWVTDGSSRLLQIDPTTMKVRRSIETGVRLNAVAATASSVWALSGPAATAIRLDSRGRVTTRLTIVSRPGFESPYPLAIAVGGRFVWVLNGNTATVTKIDPVERTIVATIPIGIEHLPVRVAAGQGAAWVANGDGTLSRIDAVSNAVTTIAVGHRLKDVTVAAGAVWTTTGSGLSGGSVTTAPTQAGTIKALPPTFCSPLYYAAGARPTLMFASDLPLQGASRTSAAQVSQAIQFVLKKHGFRAGRYSVAYQSCDDSTAPEGFATPEKCSANARAFSNDHDVIALVAPFNSGCTQEELPIANAARGGPLPMISFSNTVVEFTRTSAGTPSGLTRSFYPTGIRNYVRIVPADDFQGAANAVLARRVGAKRIYIVREPFAYGSAIAAAFRRAARHLGLKVVATTEWDPDAGAYRPLARAVARSGADTVFVAGSMYAGGDKVVRSVRSSLGPRVRIITPDGFTPVSQAVQFIGAEAEGVTVSVPGAPNERLPRRGKEFIRAFEHAVGETPYPYSVYAAQATEVLLRAIAASDGTRASVRTRLFDTRITNGILGNFSIDARGDTTANAITIYRIRRGKPTLFDVITPSSSLVRR